MDPTIKSVLQADVEGKKAKRNLKRDRSLKAENDDAKRGVVRNDEQAMVVVDEVAAEDRIAMPKARDWKSRKLRGHLKI
jgi:hypothetical protein